MNQGKEHPTAGSAAQSVSRAMDSRSAATGIDIVDISQAIWKGRWIIVVVTIAFTLGSVIYALQATPIFRADVVITPVGQPQQVSGLGGLGGLASLAGINLRTNNDSRHPLAILRSRKFIADYIDEKNLLPTLFADEWDSKKQEWIMDQEGKQRDIRDGVKRFIEDVRSISEDPKSGLVTLSIEWTDAVTAAKWANELVDRINSQVRLGDIADSQRKLDYLNGELGKSNLVELRQAISRVIEEQISAMMLAQAQTEYAFKVIDPAIVPKVRVRPRRTIIVFVATIMGGLFAFLIIISRFAIDRIKRRAAPDAGS